MGLAWSIVSHETACSTLSQTFNSQRFRAISDALSFVVSERNGPPIIAKENRLVRWSSVMAAAHPDDFVVLDDVEDPVLELGHLGTSCVGGCFHVGEDPSGFPQHNQA